MAQNAGIIVFNSINETIILTGDGNPFPKTSITALETYLETAWRGLKENTGLSCNSVELFDVTVDETDDLRNLSSRYFVGYVPDLRNCVILDQEADTFTKIKWWQNVGVALNSKILTHSEKRTLKQAHEICINTLIKRHRSNN
jgi:ADP-ribose pyrophosphatase YjhB (NUDIX family)